MSRSLGVAFSELPRHSARTHYFHKPIYHEAIHGYATLAPFTCPTMINTLSGTIPAQILRILFHYDTECHLTMLPVNFHSAVFLIICVIQVKHISEHACHRFNVVEILLTSFIPVLVSKYLLINIIFSPSSKQEQLFRVEDVIRAYKHELYVYFNNNTA